MKKAIFLDRDGTLIEDNCYVQKLEDLRIIENCECKKPNKKYKEEIVSREGINLLTSWVIGGHPSDIVMGRNAGRRTVNLLSGHGRKHFDELRLEGINPTIISADFLSAAKEISKYENENI